MDSRLHLAVDTLLDRCYRIKSVLGSGGFGITYAAEDINLGRIVAIKEYYPEEFGDRDSSMSVRAKSERHKSTFEWGRTSFVREARTLARFQHASVVRVTRVFEENSTAYMVMDFEQGQSLGAWLKSLGRPPSQQELDRIAEPLLEALELMHTQDFLHRDIAPDNIIIREDGTPVLLDFGAARRAVAERSRALTGIVKAGYSPHEQYAADSRLQGPWTDIYALGATFYRAVTGKPPEEATLRMADDHMPGAANSAVGSYRPGFLAAIDACLVVRPKDRPQSIAELRPRLLGTAPQQSTRLVSQSAAPSATPVPKASTRRGWIAIPIAAVVLLAGGYGAFEYSRQLQLDAANKLREVEQERAQAAARKQAQEEAAARKKAEDEAAAKAAEAQRQQEAVERRERDRFAAEARARRELDALRQGDAGWLGVKIQNLDADMATSLGLPEPKGAIVTEVTTPGPAAEAGVKVGDVILAVNGNPVSNSIDLAKQISGNAPNTTVELRTLRGKGYRNASVKLGRLPKGVAKLDDGKAEMGYVGLVVAKGTGALSDSLVVSKVEDASDAAQKGIKAGDVILEMGGTAIRSVEDFANSVRNALGLGRRAVLLRIKSGEEMRFVAVQLSRPKGQ